MQLYVQQSSHIPSHYIYNINIISCIKYILSDCLVLFTKSFSKSFVLAELLKISGLYGESRISFWVLLLKPEKSYEKYENKI